MSSQSPERRHIHFGINVLSDGAHPAAWQAPESDPFGALTIEHWTKIAQISEAAKLDAIFLADSPSLYYPEGGPMNPLDPGILLATLAARTERIGLVPTISTSFEEPYNLARRVASLDHLSKGRAGWNIVTSLDPSVAANFGDRPHLEKHERYARAGEFVDVVCKLWDSWQDDALVGDKQHGLWANSQRIHAIKHRGEHFHLDGPLNLPRSPQGRPVLVQAGGSPGGLDLAARHAEAVFGWHPVLAGSVAYRADLRRRAASYGRGANVPLLLPGLAFTLGGTEGEAHARRDQLDELAGPRVLATLAGQIGADPADLRLDERLPASLLDPKSEPPGSRGMGGIALELARSENLTVRQLLRRVMFHRNLVGTPEQLADSIEEWFRAGAADGFNLMPDIGISGLTDFADHVVPILQKRGIFRTEYAGSTLRDHLGLDRPSRHDSVSSLQLAS